MNTVTIIRNVTRVSYAKHGNMHNPTIEYFYVCPETKDMSPRLSELKSYVKESLGTNDCTFVVVNSERANEEHARYPFAKHPKG